MPSEIHKLLNGPAIEDRLNQLALIGGDGHSVSRLALSPEDFAARNKLIEWMKQAGMQVETHPLGLIATYPGTDPNLPSVALMSHFDSVPDGGKYDGTVGVASAIEIVNTLYAQGIQPTRGITIVALTGEESSRFNLALFGSRGMFHGLTDQELDAQREGDISIRQALVQAGYDPESLRHPRFNPTDFHAIIELHVSQDGRLEETGLDLAVIEAIAAPSRHRVVIGSPLEPDDQVYRRTKYFSLKAAGIAGHSGTTPMGETRADGLAAISDPLLALHYHIQQKLAKLNSSAQIAVGNLTVENQALNKIPGPTKTVLRITASKAEDIDKAETLLTEYINRRNIAYTKTANPFPQNPISLQPIEPPPPESARFFSPKIINRRHELAARIIKAVKIHAERTSDHHVVGTVGTYYCQDTGQIVLGIDVRGIDATTRDAVVTTIKDSALQQAQRLEVNYEISQLPGSGNPVSMDPELVSITTDTLANYEIGSYAIDFSAAGHDVMNAASAGFRTLLLFIPSRHGGISHHPDEYSNPGDLEKGVRALCALTLRLTQS